ncbi:MAG TPA: lysylphosphatidylglycerol synthase transmembrane domain-containing protein [bacterium]|nr:lysylphosphatidylglycerol synthase transmembrane domain-containing protein [bacterium]
MKKVISLLLKISISGIFLFIVLKKINLSLLSEIFKNSNNFLVLTGLFIFIGTSFLIAFRYFLIVNIYLGKKKPVMYIWKLTMIGLFFNMFLPTSSGGDAVKIFYLIKDDEKKMLPAISVLIDRFIGAITILTMGTFALFFSQINDQRVKIFIFSLTGITLFFYFFLSYRNFAKKLYNPIGKILPSSFDEKLRTTYSLFNFYFKEKKTIFFSLIMSFFLQFLSVVGNFFVAVGLIKEYLPLSIFFIYTPLIWVSTIIPSIGGVGVREFTYVFFFKNYLGEEKAFALSLIVLFSIIIQAIIGYITFLTFKGQNFSKPSHNQHQK